MISLPILGQQSRVLLTGARPEGTNQSAVSDWLKCKRYYLLRHVAKVSRRGQARSMALDRGTMFHEHMYANMGGKPGRVAAKMQEAIKQITTEMPVERQAKELNLLNDNEAMGRAMAAVMLKRFPVASDKLEVLTLEQTVQATCTGSLAGFNVFGTLDLLGRDDKGRLWILDYKTIGRDPRSRAATTSFELQGQLYGGLGAVWLSSMKLTGLIHGVIHNIVRTPSIKYCSKDASFDAYVKRCEEWYDEKHAAYLKYPDTESPVVFRSFVNFAKPIDPAKVVKRGKLVIAEVLDRPTLNILRAVRRATRPSALVADDFPRDISGKACFSFNRECEYLPLCQSDESAWAGLIGPNGRFNVNALTVDANPEEDE